jgi:hypothetical protein
MEDDAFGFTEDGARKVVAATRITLGISDRRTNAGGPLPPMITRPDAAMFFRLTSDGGNTGTQTGACTLTYSVYKWADRTKSDAIATSVAMTGSGQRTAVGAYVAASYGQGLLDPAARTTNNPSGVVLLWADEVPATFACTGT